jgi:hypothetical protein
MLPTIFSWPAEGGTATMGLDQYMYLAARDGQHQEFWDGATLDTASGQWTNPTVQEPTQVAVWRKHPNLEGWMEQLWRSRAPKGTPHDPFNQVELELTWDDLDQLQKDVMAGQLPVTTGFFFGDDASEYYKDYDLEAIRQAKAAIFTGLRAFYRSSW